MLMQARTTKPMIAMATKPITSQTPSQTPIVQLMARVAVGSRKRKPHSDGGHESPHHEISDDPDDIDMHRQGPHHGRQRPGQQHGGGQVAQRIKAAGEFGHGDFGLV